MSAQMSEALTAYFTFLSVECFTCVFMCSCFPPDFPLGGGAEELRAGTGLTIKEAVNTLVVTLEELGRDAAQVGETEAK